MQNLFAADYVRDPLDYNPMLAPPSMSLQAETLAGFAEYVGQHSKTREDIKTWFDAIELDDYASFGGKA